MSQLRGSKPPVCHLLICRTVDIVVDAPMSEDRFVLVSGAYSVASPSWPRSFRWSPS
jgi:hypothetical protein